MIEYTKAQQIVIVRALFRDRHVNYIAKSERGSFGDPAYATWLDNHTRLEISANMELEKGLTDEQLFIFLKGLWFKVDRDIVLEKDLLKAWSPEHDEEWQERIKKEKEPLDREALFEFADHGFEQV